MKSKVVAIALAAVIGLGVVSSEPAHATVANAPVASVASSHSAVLDKTRFVLHMGAAFYAFHHFVWAKYRNGELNLRHKANLVKAGIALLFAYHEVKVSYAIAQNSRSGALRALVSPLNALGGNMSAAGQHLKQGQFSSSELRGVNSSVSSFGQQSGNSGYAIADRAVPVPGL